MEIQTEKLITAFAIQLKKKRLRISGNASNFFLVLHPFVNNGGFSFATAIARHGFISMTNEWKLIASQTLLWKVNVKR